jgi:calcineurin-like phosphoesterase
MGWYLDGRVSAVVGTHTHVGTVDARVLPGGTACVSDIGMVGPWQSVIGDDKDEVLKRFLTGMHDRLTVARGSRITFNSVLVTTNLGGKAIAIERIDREAAI